MLIPGLNITIGGQFGSCGKGLFNSYLAKTEDIDIAVTNAGTNSGHTFYYRGKKCVVKQLPVSGIINDRCIIYLCAGAVINPRVLLQEIEEFNIPPSRVRIHPRAAIITDEAVKYERHGPIKKIASTRSGVGRAISNKVSRCHPTASQVDSIQSYTTNFGLQSVLENGYTALFEAPQGLGLSLNSGFSYPYCTSRDITVSSILSDAQVHPSCLGRVISCIRTYPIRVGNIYEDGKLVGYSGPFYNDSVECTWENLGVEPEYTTNTNRVRRVATFSHTQYAEMLDVLKPDKVFLNFANYLSGTDLAKLLNMLPEVTHLGYGPKTGDIRERL